MLDQEFLVLFVLLLSRFATLTDSVTFVNGSDMRVKRETATRYLVFPQGSNVQLVYCMTIGTYSKPRGMFTVGVTAGLAWELPHRNTVPYRKPAEVYHRRSRRELYRKVELMLRTQGKDGKACVLKGICNAAARDSEEVGKGTFLEEILHSIFTLPRGSYDIEPITDYDRAYLSNENCAEANNRCPDIF